MARIPLHNHADRNSGGRLTTTSIDGASGGGSTIETVAENHIVATSDAHDASAVSIVDTAGYFAATDAEAVLAELVVRSLHNIEALGDIPLGLAEL